MQLTLLQFALALAGSSSGHTIFQEIYVNGKSAGHKTGIRVPNFDGPIQDVTSNDLICNGGPNPLNQPLPKDIIPIPAGAKITTEWHHTLDGLAPSDVADPIDKGHVGPIIYYMAKVDSALTTTLTGLKWFKIYEDGLTPDGKWAVDRLYANHGKVDMIMPPCIPNGDYLLRGELIALHGGQTIGGAQLYMECAQVTVTGGGNVLPPGYAIPGIYAATDPGINFNIYNKATSYPIPGPKLFTCDGTTGSPGNFSTSDTSQKKSKDRKKFTSRITSRWFED